MNGDPVLANRYGGSSGGARYDGYEVNHGGILLVAPAIDFSGGTAAIEKMVADYVLMPDRTHPGAEGHAICSGSSGPNSGPWPGR